MFPFQKCVSFSRGSFFFTRIGSRPYQNSGKYRRVFLFHQNWFATLPKFREIQEGLSFSPELVRNHTKIQGNTGGSFFFTRIGSGPYLNSGKYRRVFLFHQNWFATIPKFREIQNVFPFQKDVSFSKCV